ncbi:hypothetical protein NA56DRAFT_697996 [Hyaloscypha hepaticicola]|uniref:Uncharacterized protein n=1 Tax=Hyaloscypha hepaticicola TaxID=2082293 RepID=A0A2J6QKJ1_9HELO|nr:hypothetical protein NA56DRAFT_697996 [Hyaloscypha hepaticicola]
MPQHSSSFQPNIIPSSLSPPPLDTFHHDHPPMHIHFLDLPSPFHSQSKSSTSFNSHSPTIPPPPQKRTPSLTSPSHGGTGTVTPESKRAQITMKNFYITTVWVLLLFQKKSNGE